MLGRSSTRGVTLIELMIGIALLAMLVTVGLPSLGAWIGNSKVRNAAEGLQTGLSLARTEAMRRNQNVEFVLTNDIVDLGTVSTVTPSASGRSWLVRYMDPATATYLMVESKSAAEGSGRVEGEGSPVQVAASAPLIVFRGMGGAQGFAGSATFDLSNPTAGACHTTATPGPIRCLRVQVSLGGNIRMCDPTTSAPDPRAC